MHQQHEMGLFFHFEQKLWRIEKKIIFNIVQLIQLSRNDSNFFVGNDKYALASSVNQNKNYCLKGNVPENKTSKNFIVSNGIVYVFHWIFMILFAIKKKPSHFWHFTSYAPPIWLGSSEWQNLKVQLIYVIELCFLYASNNFWELYFNDK